jgi:Tfp pilus assembly protein PilO
VIPLKQQIVWSKHVQWMIAGVAVCGMAACYFFSYRPNTQRLTELRTNIATAEQSLARNEEAARDLDAIKGDVRRLREQITRSRQLPPQEDLPKFIREISDLSRGVSLQRFEYKPEPTRRRELCGESPIALTFTGKFPDVTAFLRQAEEMPRMLRTRKLQLRSRDGKTGEVDVQVLMSIFYADAK